MEPELNIAPVTLSDPAPQPTINIDTGVAPAQPPSDDVAQTRAAKAHMGMGDIVKQSYDEIYRNIASGRESALRENAAMDIAAKGMETRQQAIIKMAAEKGSALTLEDITKLTPPTVRPEGVIEQTYSRAYVNTVKEAAARIPDNVLTDAQAQDPAAVEAYMNKGSDILFKREYATTAAQNLQPDVDRGTSFVGRDPVFGDQYRLSDLDVRNFLTWGFYESAVLRGNTKNTSSFGLLGDVLDNQAKELLALPQGEFEPAFDKIMGNLKEHDPELAQKFANAVSGMSTSDRYIQNAFEALNIATFGLTAAGLRFARRMASGAPRDLGGLTQGPDGVYRPNGGGPTPPPSGGPGTALTPPRAAIEGPYVPDNVDRAAMAVQDVLRSSANPVITKASIAEGAGDVREAAVQKTITSVTEPNPQRDATDTLFSAHRASTEAVRREPGNLSREAHTRLLDAADGYENRAVNVLTESVRVLRTPILAEQGFRDILDNISTLFPGKSNTILDASVRWEPYSATNMIDVKIGNYTGEPFSSFELARNHAAINGYPVQVAGTPADTLYIPKAAAQKLESVKTDEKGTRFYVDKDIEVVSSPHPQPGFIPYNTKTGKFLPELTEQSARIEQQGLGFHVVVSIPMDETQTRIRDALIKSDRAKSVSNKDTRTITSVGNSIFGLVRNPYDTLSVVESENRAKTVFGQTKFLDFIKEEISPVEQIYKDDLLTHRPITYMKNGGRTPSQDFTRALVHAQTAEDPVTKLPGYYMQTPLEIQQFWLTTFDRPASELEQNAYLAITRLDHFDHVLRNIMSYRNKARLGVMQFQFTTNVADVKTNSPWFEAQLLNRVPAVGDDIMLIVSSDGSEKYWHNMNPQNQQAFRDLVSQGRYTGGQVYNPEERPIERQDKDGNPLRIRFVFSNAMTVKPITYDQVGYRGGGHWEYDYDNAVKQSIIRPQWVGGKFQHTYEGDNTFGFVGSRAEGETFAKHMNEVARLIRAKDIKAAKAYAKDHFDIEWKKLYASFRPSKNPVTGEVQPPRFSTDPRQEFRVVPKGKTIAQLDQQLAQKFTKTHPVTGAIQSTFIDGTKHGSLARNFQVAFTQARDSYALNEFFNKGTQDVPFYEFRPANLTDPITTLTRAMERAVSSIYMDDMKIMAMEHWLQENMDLMEDPVERVRSSPFWYFNEGKLLNNPHNAPRIINAMTNRYKIKDFIGTPSVIDAAMHGVRQSMSDALYAAGRDRAADTLGKTAVGKPVKAALLAPEWLLDRISAPVDFLRGMTFHTVLGLLNWTQIVAQSMAYTTIYGLAGPVNAAAGSMGALLHQWSRVNQRPNIVAELDRKATNFGWRPGEFTEAMHFLDRSGFGIMGNSISIDNGLHKNNFFMGDGSRFLRASQIFFDLANQNVRYGSYYTAFFEFRKKNPLKKITQVEEGKILFRANYLNTLMSRDANTVLNKGLVGVPMMFFDYQKKAFDVFTSTHIGATGLERAKVRARMILINSLLYGFIGTTGLSSIPGGDIVRKKMIESGYVPGANTVSTLLMEGPTAMVGAYITGKGDMEQGTFYDFNNRFGPNGYQVIRDLLESDANFWKIITGAVGSKIGDTLSRLSPFVQVMYSQMQSDPKLKTFKLTNEDWLQLPDVINTWKMGRRLAYAEAYGKWLDSHGRPTSDVGKIDALFRSLTGLKDVMEDDIFLRNKIRKEQKENWDRAVNDFEHYSRLADQAAGNGDTQQADQYNKNAFFQLESANVPIEYYGKAIQRRASMNRNTLDKNIDSYYIGLIPMDKRQIYLDAYKQIKKK